MASILITNDDGIHADGLAQLAESLASLGDTVIVAPEQERSAASHALTLHNPLRIREMADSRYAVDGTPADCVYLGALQVMEPKPDLIVSGINHGSNIGDDVTYSGTIAAALEGTILGVPSIAISQEAKPDVPPWIGQRAIRFQRRRRHRPALGRVGARDGDSVGHPAERQRAGGRDQRPTHHTAGQANL